MLSIVVLTHNRRALLEKCLRSLLAQDCSAKELEVIVSDDGSTDGTSAMVEKMALRMPNLRYAYQVHKGIPAARNLGLKEASGEIIAFLADDYELAPDYARTVIRLLEEHPEAMVVRFKVVPASRNLSNLIGHWCYSFGLIRRLIPDSTRGKGIFNRAARRLRAVAKYEEKATMKHGLEAAGGAAFRREVFQILGMFDESLKRSEDTDMGFRLRKQKIGFYYYPIHQIFHNYEQFPRQALVKSFRTGKNRHKFQRKHIFKNKDCTLTTFALAAEKISGIAEALLYCFRIGALLEVLLLAPFLLLLETANKLGYLTAILQERYVASRRE